MTTFCHECGRYQGHEPTCSQSEQVTIDDLSHENSLIRARNERLEAEKVELLRELLKAATALAVGSAILTELTGAYENTVAIIEKHTGSAT